MKPMMVQVYLPEDLYIHLWEEANVRNVTVSHIAVEHLQALREEEAADARWRRVVRQALLGAPHSLQEPPEGAKGG